MMYFFTIGFIAIGIYYIVKGVKLRKSLDSGSEDYAQTRKKSNGYILLGLYRIGNISVLHQGSPLGMVKLHRPKPKFHSSSNIRVWRLCKSHNAICIIGDLLLLLQKIELWISLAIPSFLVIE